MQRLCVLILFAACSAAGPAGPQRAVDALDLGIAFMLVILGLPYLLLLICVYCAQKWAYKTCLEVRKLREDLKERRHV